MSKHDQSALEKALDPRSNVALRANVGGPAPAETKRMIRESLALIAAAQERLAERRRRIERALESNGCGAPTQQSCGVCKAPQHEDGINSMESSLSWTRMPFIPAAEQQGIRMK